MSDNSMISRDGSGPGPVVSPAGAPEIAVLARFHRLMFEEIWAERGFPVVEESMRAVEEQYIQKLREGFSDGSCRAWVVKKDGRVVSGGAVSIAAYVPVPFDPSLRIGFVHSIYTEKDERHRGHAGRIVRAATAFCKDAGIHRVYLFASADGKPVYEKEGFSAVENTMLAVLR
ncbi:GNAT family N-acetyltransferase [Methanoregula sp. UBA64]|jgi:N-acetylglutamate synthase-like GNAT family acetyltransferase|uniref:GNAT family N-acetyltransferase n=1 Tax=Methanoregula sp. UBA64 TaxID=1915554 RepID=UPI0025E80D2B|nr:GNAT family N-acetyltransferase [Methanoregula sp. UBA64]